MYKNLKQHINNDLRKKEEYFNDIFKYEDKKPHSVKDRQPHFIFSVGNPLYQAKNTMDHGKVMEFLTDKGYKAESMSGKYGNEERSILVHNPPHKAVKHLQQFAKDLGEESSIYSNGYDHELHYHNGENAGLHAKGQGTAFHKQAPQDFYSTLQDGSHFTHNFTDELHDSKKSMITPKKEKMNKSELNGRPYKLTLAKAENLEKKHPLVGASPDTKLIHYSPTKGLKELDPKFHGVRKIGAEAKQGAPTHGMNFFYLEGTEPESLVTTGSKSKYVSSLGNKKVYDIGTDPDGLYGKAKEIADQRQMNPGIVQKDDYHQAIRDAGYHGIYNSSLGDTMNSVVGMFDKMHINEEHDMHLNDFKEASAENHHASDRSKESAEKFAATNGHPHPEFLHNLKESLKQE